MKLRLFPSATLNLKKTFIFNENIFFKIRQTHVLMKLNPRLILLA